MDSPPAPRSKRNRLQLALVRVANRSLREFGFKFLLAFNLRAGLSVLLRVIRLARAKKFVQIFDINRLVGEQHVVFREDAARLGLCVGGFAGLYHFVSGTLRALRGRQDGYNAFAGGALAGSMILLLDRERRRSLAMYAAVRALQCGYNACKARGWWHFWGSSWNHGDALLFSLCCAQIMYAYVMRPGTLPKSYNDFIVNTGPIRKEVLAAVRANCRGLPIDAAAVHDVCAQAGASCPPLPSPLQIVPCGVMHPQMASCTRHNVAVFASVFRKIAPLYLSLTLAPAIVLRTRRFITSPFSVAVRSMLSAARSSAFLAAFNSIYMGVVCAQRHVVTRDHRLWYWVAGALAGTSILIERKSRRSELTLYALPRAADALFQALVDRQWIAGLPRGEVALFTFSTGALCYFFANESHTMAPLVSTVLSRVLGTNPTAKPTAPGRKRAAQQPISCQPADSEASAMTASTSSESVR